MEQKLCIKEKLVKLKNFIPAEPAAPYTSSGNTDQTGAGIGIDAEEISLMPATNDFRDHEFYTMNFAAAEIAYCILQPDSRASFAGLFAAKEAIVKADNSYKNKPFHTIFIDHLPGGKPFHSAIQHERWSSTRRYRRRGRVAKIRKRGLEVVRYADARIPKISRRAH